MPKELGSHRTTLTESLAGEGSPFVVHGGKAHRKMRRVEDETEGDDLNSDSFQRSAFLGLMFRATTEVNAGASELPSSEACQALAGCRRGGRRLGMSSSHRS